MNILHTEHSIVKHFAQLEISRCAFGFDYELTENGWVYPGISYL